MVQEPRHLRTGEIGGEGKAGDLPEAVWSPVGCEVFHQLGRPGVLPDDGVVDRMTGRSFPQHGCLTLVGDPYGGEVPGAQTCSGQRFGHNSPRVVPDLFGAVLYPPRLGEVLPVWPLGGRHHCAALVEYQETGASGALVQCPYEGHGSTVFPGTRRPRDRGSWHPRWPRQGWGSPHPGAAG